MININDSKYERNEFVSREGILKYISDYDIFKHYIGDFIVGGIMESPLREKDKTPSFGIFWSRKYDMLLFKDQATGQKGDCFYFTQQYFNINNITCLEKIAIDFNIDSNFKINSEYKLLYKNDAIIHSNKEIKQRIKHDISLGIKRRNWNKTDKSYWESYGISRSTLEEYYVAPIELIFLNDNIMIPDKLAYAYTEKKDNLRRYKIYQPFNKKIKWLNNFVDGTLSGFTQIPKNGKLLVITSSLKDGMCLKELGYDFISPQAESHTFKSNVINDLKNRFENIIIFFDHDEAGLKSAERNKEIYGFNYITTGSIQYKDISDFRWKYGEKETINLIKSKIHGIYSNTKT